MEVTLRECIIREYTKLISWFLEEYPNREISIKSIYNREEGRIEIQLIVDNKEIPKNFFKEEDLLGMLTRWKKAIKDVL